MSRRVHKPHRAPPEHFVLLAWMPRKTQPCVCSLLHVRVNADEVGFFTESDLFHDSSLDINDSPSIKMPLTYTANICWSVVHGLMPGQTWNAICE